MNRLALGDSLMYFLLAIVILYGGWSSQQAADRLANHIDQDVRDKIIATHMEPRVVADKEGYVIDATPAAVALFGTTTDKLIGSKVADWIPDSERDEHAKWYGDAMTAGESIRKLTQCRIKRGDGRQSGPQQIRVSVQQINGQVYAVAVFSRKA